ncbi:MAG TPA: GNAT family N-acetyltransferase [Gemmatimonadales bacterium]
MTPPVAVRPFAPDDAEQVRRLVLGIQRDEFAVPVTLEEQPDLRDVPGRYQRGLGGFWVAAAGDAVVGTVGLPDIGHDQGALRKMFVAPTHRGAAHGVGAALLRTCLRHAEWAGMTDVFLGTMDHFLAAQRFYRKWGFTPVPADRLPPHFPRVGHDTLFYRYAVCPLRKLGPDSFTAVTATLCDAFADYPVMRYVLGPGDDYRERLTRLIGFFVTARLLRGDLVLATFAESEPSGIALVTLPDTVSPAAVEAAREEVWAALGAGARERYDAFSRACQPFAIDRPHLHLNMLGVPPRHQGRGIARVLLGRVHAVSWARTDSVGVTLSTEDPANLSLYRHFGYRTVGHVRVAPELESWGFFREDSA